MLDVSAQFMARQMSNQVQDLRDHAERFRRLAGVVEDDRNRRQLLQMAKELDEQAAQLEEASDSSEN